MQFAIVIMAAGKGTRLKTKRPKVLHEVGGKTLLRHVVDAARQIVPPEDIYVIVGHEAELVKASLSGVGVQFIEQKEQRGTGHAMQEARQAVEGYTDVIVLSGDVPLIRPETIKKIRDFHLERRAAMTVLTAEPEDLHGYGRVIRKSRSSHEIREIVEQKALTPQKRPRREKSTPESTPLPASLCSRTSAAWGRRTLTANSTSQTWLRFCRQPGNGCWRSRQRTQTRCWARIRSRR